MSRDYLVLIEILLVFGGVMWFGFAQLRSLKKLRQAREESARRDADSSGRR